MHHMLKEILKRKRLDLDQHKKNLFLQLFKKNKLVVIGEVKVASPSSGRLLPNTMFEFKVNAYANAGIDAISVITETHFFHGDKEDVQRVKQAASLPVLQKDFIIDAQQIYEAKAAGADALLLIARIVSTKKLVEFVDLCLTVGIAPVVEIYNMSDLRKALHTKTRIIAVNARDLDTFSVDINTACMLLTKVPKRYIKLGFSGIHSQQEVALYKRAGVQGVLIGTALVQANDPRKFVKEVCL